MVPDYLYKYTPLRCPTDEKRDIQLAALLTDPALWFSAPASFNDPMDCKPGFRFKAGTPDEREKSRLTAIKALVTLDHPGAQGKELSARYREYEKLYPSFNEELSEKAHKALLNDIRTRLVGVLCLSECDRDPVMFYHYGDDHKGMCLKFRTRSFFQYAESVQYGMEYPVVEFFDSSDNDAQYEKIFLTKYDGWRYEHEFRVVNTSQHPDQRLTEYPVELLEGVIFGYLMPQADRDYAISLLEQRGSPVTLYEAKISREQYLLDIVQLG
jgi:hypothetical protein